MEGTYFDLPKLAGEAGATVALIIATAVLQSWLAGKYAPTLERYRILCGELRGNHEESRRRDSLREQITAYKRRLRLLNLGSELLSWALIAAVATVAAASLSELLPGRTWVSVSGTVFLFSAFLFVLLATIIDILGTRIDRKTIPSEAGYLDGING